MPAPRDPLREHEAEALLPKARLAAAAAGVTRLAEITRLDRIGLPVWQAVRPMSRALSVHQGKGGCDADAQLGALLEAVESHSAESFNQPGPVCRFDELPATGRPASFSDFAAHRHKPPAADARYRWAEASDLLTGERLHLPFEVASMDFTQSVPSRFDRASNGIGAAASAEGALAVALHELIERDGVVEWQAQSLVERTASQLRPQSVSFEWFHFWVERLAEAGAVTRCYSVPSITGSPLFLCEIRDNRKDAALYRSLSGRGCHPDPEVALFKAVAEAIQGRATYIAGAREDILANYSVAARAIPVPFGLPLGSGLRGVDFGHVAGGLRTPAALGERLAKAGYPKIAVLALAQIEGFHVVRAFAYGLGSMTRRRRRA